MKNFLVVAVLATNMVQAQTNSVDISLSDIKEALYKLIIDVEVLKGNDVSMLVAPIVSDTNNTEVKTITIQSIKDSKDVLIEEFVMNNQLLLEQ